MLESIHKHNLSIITIINIINIIIIIIIIILIITTVTIITIIILMNLKELERKEGGEITLIEPVILPSGMYYGEDVLDITLKTEAGEPKKEVRYYISCMFHR